MTIRLSYRQVKSLLTPSNLPASDYVINPYVGCPHGCRYCYASFMKRFSGHSEPWGEFLDIKQCDTPLDRNKLYHKSVFLSSVTDCYNPYEAQYACTRAILKQLVGIACALTISTKSALVLRDIDLLRQCRDVKVALSINTLEEGFQTAMDHADPIPARIQAGKQLHGAGIPTVLFLSPIFPYLSDVISILETCKEWFDEVWFEDLNLKGQQKKEILHFIETEFPQYFKQYEAIYLHHDRTYWQALKHAIIPYCEHHDLNYTFFFDHAALVKQKKQRIKTS